jgi:hypothetical protein
MTTSAKACQQSAPETAEPVADTKGRPLGLQHDRSGNLIVADARRGLLAITPAGQVTVLADRFENQPLKFVDDLDIAADGTIYFTDASQRYGIDEDDLDFHGRSSDPDNISFNGRNLFWVALAGPRVKVLDETLASPFRRRVIYRVLSTGLLTPPAPERYGCVIAIDLDGRTVATLQDPGGAVIHFLTSVNERDGRLYLGGLEMDRIATLPVPPALIARN